MQLLIHFTSQITQSFCSVATSAMLLNALTSQGLPAPTQPTWSPYAYFEQEAIFRSDCVSAVATHTGEPFSAGFVATHGATLDEWSAYLSCYAEVEATHAGDSDVDGLRAGLEAAYSFADAPKFLGINFHRPEIAEVGGGHMSPIAAYDADSDRALLLDVSRYKYPPVWVALPKLYESMNTTDSASGLTRGWVVVSKPSAQPAWMSSAWESEERPPGGAAYPAIRSCYDTLADMNAFDDYTDVVNCARWPPETPSDRCFDEGGSERGGGGGAGAALVGGVFVVGVLLGGAVSAAVMYAYSRRQALMRQTQYQNVVAESKGDFDDGEGTISL